MRIGICGCSGTGKSVLAECIAKEYNLAYLPAKQITSKILRRDGFDYGSGMQVEKFLATEKRQNEILEGTIEQIEGVDSFVSDRTPIDLASYAILEREDKKVRDYVENCRRMLNYYDFIFLCPWISREIVDNQKRTLNPWYQFSVDAVIKSVLDMFDCPVVELESEDIDSRIKMVRITLSI